MKRQLLDVVASYDIADDRRRTKLAELFEDYGVRVQYSVFELTLKPRELKELRQRAGKLLRGHADSIRYYVLCRNCLAEREVDTLPARRGSTHGKHGGTTAAV